MGREKIILLIGSLLFTAGCTVEFIPEIDENREYLVVEGMITDQQRVNTIKLSRSLPLGKPLVRKPVRGATVIITDENGDVTTLQELSPGAYSTDSTIFSGHVGGRYALGIKTPDAAYSTDFIEMKPVPPISSLYYEKVDIVASADSNRMEQGCRIYLDTHDPSGGCLYFRWNYVETYEYHVPYDVINKECWVTERSDRVLIKNTSVYNQASITKYPLNFIDNYSDKLKEKYSILVNQYSLSKSEFDFWEKVENISQNVGSLYDITPVAIPSNIICNTDPKETVLGYFSVSAVTQKRLFIKDKFVGLPVFYTYCATDTITGMLPENGLNVDYWVLEDYSDEIPPFWVVSTYRECADCTTRGTKVRPSFWE